MVVRCFMFAGLPSASKRMGLSLLILHSGVFPRDCTVILFSSRYFFFLQRAVALHANT